MWAVSLSPGVAGAQAGWALRGDWLAATLSTDLREHCECSAGVIPGNQTD